LPAGKVGTALGIRTVSYQAGSKNLALADEPLA